MTATQDEPGLTLRLAADVEASLGTIGTELQRQRRDRDELNQAIYPVEIPPATGTVPASGTLTIANPELFGPENGIVWDVRRVTVVGLAANEVVNLYRGATGTSNDAQPNNKIAQITNQTTNAKDGTYSPGLGACLLRGNQVLTIQGTGLTNGEIITVTWDAISVPAKWLGAYLL